MYRDLIAEENAWWDSRYEEQAAAEADAMIAAIDSADLYEFDSDEEREAYILEYYEDRMTELAYEKGPVMRDHHKARGVE